MHLTKSQHKYKKIFIFCIFLFLICSERFPPPGRPFKSLPFVKKHHNPMAVKCKIKIDACSIEMHGRLQQRAASCHAWIFPRPKKCPPDTFCPTLLGRPFKSHPFVKKHHNPMGCGVFWRSERDLNPRAHFGTPTPLAGEPLRPLGYHSESKHVQLLPGYSSTRGIVCQEEKC